MCPVLCHDDLIRINNFCTTTKRGKTAPPYGVFSQANVLLWIHEQYDKTYEEFSLFCCCNIALHVNQKDIHSRFALQKFRTILFWWKWKIGQSNNFGAKTVGRRKCVGTNRGIFKRCFEIQCFKIIKNVSFWIRAAYWCFLLFSLWICFKVLKLQRLYLNHWWQLPSLVSFL